VYTAKVLVAFKLSQKIEEGTLVDITDRLEHKYPDFKNLSPIVLNHVYALEDNLHVIDQREAQVNKRESRLSEQEKAFLEDVHRAESELGAAWDDIKASFEKMRAMLDSQRDDVHDNLKQHLSKLASYRKAKR
jgi:chromosome segregation ATPase